MLFAAALLLFLGLGLSASACCADTPASQSLCPSSLPVGEGFASSGLKRDDVSTGAWPQDNDATNAPPSLWKAYPWQITFALIFIVAEVLLFVQLWRVMSERKTALADLSKERALLEHRVQERTDALQQSEERFRKLFENASDAIFLGDASGRFLDVNREAERQSGYSREELLRMGAADLDVNHTPESVVAFHETMGADQPVVFEAVNRRKNGEHIHLEVRGIRLFEGETGAVLMGIARDITLRKRLEEELRDIAFHDSLTRLPNRRLLLDRLSHALLARKRLHDHLAVLFIDLNNFKVLNDAHGHDVGDLLLMEVASRLKLAVRESDTVARLGGDEFVVLLEGLGDNGEQAVEYAGFVAAKIRRVLSEEYVFADIRHSSSASVGIKICRAGDNDPDQILKEADAAMYEDKRNDERQNGSSAPLER